jgi:hypothetical protein
VYGNIYSISSTNFTVAAIKTLVQLKAGAAAPCKILRVVVSARGVTASAMVQIGIFRLSVASTVTAAVLGTSIFDDTGGNVTPACTLSTTGTGIQASAEGTYGDKPYTDDFNVLQGWEKIFTPAEQIIVPGAGIIGVVIPVAPASTAFDCTLTFQELG